MVTWGKITKIKRKENMADPTFGYMQCKIYCFLIRMRKARLEQTAMAPTHAEDNIKHLMSNVKWEQ